MTHRLDFNRPSWTSLVFYGFTFACKPLLAFLGPGGSSTYILILWSFTAPVPNFFDSAHGTACCVVQVLPPHGVDSISLMFCLGAFILSHLIFKADTEIRIKKVAVKGLLPRTWKFIVSAFRSLNTVDEFPWKSERSQKQSQPASVFAARETMVLVFSLSSMIFKNTQLQLLSTCGQLETMRRLWKPFSRPSVSDVFSRKTSSDSAGAGQTAPWKLRLTGHLHNAGSAKNWTDGFTRESPLSRKTQAPALALPNAQWPFCTHPTGRYPCLLCPWGCCKAPSRPDFSSENSHDDLVKHLGSRSSAWSNSSVSSGLANARTWIPELGGEDLGLASACGTSPIREGGCALIHHKTSFPLKLSFMLFMKMLNLVTSFVKSC